MIEIFKEASKILLVPVAILYLLGFICINAFLGRFGMVSFDVISPRFVIAGLYPFISFVFVVFLAWELYVNLPIKKFFETSSWKLRYRTHFKFVVFLLSISFMLYLLMLIGSYKAPLKQEILVFQPLVGDYDFIGELIKKVPLDVTVSVNYVVKSGVRLFLYLSFLALILVSVGFLITKLKQAQFSWKRNDKSIKPQQNKSDSSKVAKDNKENSLVVICVFLGDLLIISIYLSAFFYSYNKLSVELYDFKSFSNQRLVTPGLLGSWMFISIIAVYGFLNSSNFGEKQLRLDIVTYFTDYAKLNLSIQQLIIPLLLSLIYFGTVVFPKIPFALGGGEPRLIKISLTEPNSALVDDKIFLIGESSQFIFVITTKENGEGGHAIQINKNIIAYIETKSQRN